jgi:hypothetical protein
MKSKMKFKLNGITFEIPSTCLKTTDYWGAPLANPTISIGRKEIPLIAKQFIKAKYPNLLVWGKSSVFANGNSSDIYVCNPDGSEMDWDSVEFRTIKSFIENLRGGRYNGMEDIYEYGDNGTSDNGTILDFSAKYITVNPKAPFGTWPDVKRMLTDMMEGKYVWGVITLEEAIKKAKGYSISDSVIEKAMAEMA